jgi:hypothetical protein
MEFEVTDFAFMSGHRVAVTIKRGHKTDVDNNEPVITINVVQSWTTQTTIGDLIRDATAEALALVHR